jgi:hypothetical protein
VDFKVNKWHYDRLSVLPVSRPIIPVPHIYSFTVGDEVTQPEQSTAQLRHTNNKTKQNPLPALNYTRCKTYQLALCVTAYGTTQQSDIPMTWEDHHGPLCCCVCKVLHSADETNHIIVIVYALLSKLRCLPPGPRIHIQTVLNRSRISTHPVS